VNVFVAEEPLQQEVVVIPVEVGRKEREPRSSQVKCRSLLSRGSSERRF